MTTEHGQFQRSRHGQFIRSSHGQFDHAPEIFTATGNVMIMSVRHRPALLFQSLTEVLHSTEERARNLRGGYLLDPVIANYDHDLPYDFYAVGNEGLKNLYERQASTWASTASSHTVRAFTAVRSAAQQVPDGIDFPSNYIRDALFFTDGEPLHDPIPPEIIGGLSGFVARFRSAYGDPFIISHIAIPGVFSSGVGGDMDGVQPFKAWREKLEEFGVHFVPEEGRNLVFDPLVAQSGLPFEHHQVGLEWLNGYSMVRFWLGETPEP